MRRTGFMTTHKNFKRFLKRLRRLRLKAFFKDPSKHAIKIDFKILDYNDTTKTQIKIIHSLRKKTENWLIFLQNIINLFYRALMFVSTISRRKNGRYKLYLETQNNPEESEKEILPNLNYTKKTETFSKSPRVNNDAGILLLNSLMLDQEQENSATEKKELNVFYESKKLIFSKNSPPEESNPKSKSPPIYLIENDEADQGIKDLHTNHFIFFKNSFYTFKINFISRP